MSRQRRGGPRDSKGNNRRRRRNDRKDAGNPDSGDALIALGPVPQLLFATGNSGKLAELRELSRGHAQVVSPAQRRESSGAVLPEVIEDGATFVANALLKALSGVRSTGLPTLADDSGLCVDALEGAPGVHSARFAGPDANDEANLKLLLERLKDVPMAGRGARFECALVLAGELAEGPGCGRSEDGIAWRAFVGAVHGRITDEPAGDSGFGYDPVFYEESLGCTFAQASSRQKHAVSHRGRAFADLLVHLRAKRLASAAAGRPLFLRRVGLNALAAALGDVLGRGLRYADRSLEGALAARPQLGSKERAAVAHLFWFALRRLDRMQQAAAAVVGEEAAGLMDGAADPRQLPAATAGVIAALMVASVDETGELIPASGARPVSALEALLQRQPDLLGQLPARKEALFRGLRKAAGRARHAAVIEGYHADFAGACVAGLGDEHARRALDYLDGRGPLTLRARSVDGAWQRVHQELQKARIPAVSAVDRGAILCLKSGRVTALPSYREGLVEIQDLGSQRIARAVQARPGELIADWCAGAGGKTLALADAMGGEGQLWALDVHAGRLEEARRRLRRAGQDWVQVIRHSRGDGPDTRLPPLDAVLVDAPCSSTGALRRNPELRWHLDEDWLGRFAAQQLAILLRAASHVRPGGRLVYATCSILPSENEEVVTRFVEERAGWTVTSQDRVGPASAQALALHPLAEIGPDGFYFAVLRAPGEPDA